MAILVRKEEFKYTHAHKADVQNLSNKCGKVTVVTVVFLIFYNFIEFLKSSLTLEIIYKMSQKNIYYSDKYYDDKYEYRHVVLPKELVKLVPKTHLMSENEWRNIGVQQSQGWVHYMTHQPEPHILLFKRPITNPPPN